MKKIRGIWLILLGAVLYIPCFVWMQVSIDTIPTWVFYVCAVVFGACMVIGLIQIVRKKDVILDDEMMNEIKEKNEKSGKKGLLRFFGI